MINQKYFFGVFMAVAMLASAQSVRGGSVNGYPTTNGYWSSNSMNGNCSGAWAGGDCWNDPYQQSGSSYSIAYGDGNFAYFGNANYIYDMWGDNEIFIPELWCTDYPVPYRVPLRISMVYFHDPNPSTPLTWIISDYPNNQYRGLTLCPYWDSTGSNFITPTIVCNTDVIIYAKLNGDGGFIKSGNGTLTLAADNSDPITGTITVDGGASYGKLSISSANNLGPDSNPLALINTGTLKYTGAEDLIFNNFINPGHDFNGGFQVDDADVALTITKDIINLSTTTPGELTKTGTGKLILTGSLNYTGLTDIQAGDLQINSPSTALVSLGDVNIANGSTLYVGNTGTNTTVTATSIVGDSLIIGAGARIVIKPRTGVGPTAGMNSLTPIPEPSTCLMLILAAMGLGIYRRR